MSIVLTPVSRHVAPYWRRSPPRIAGRRAW
jgi:hypothetical protein